MVQVTESLASLSTDTVSLYYTTDPQLSNLPLLVFHGPSTTTNSTLNSSRIQLHILTAAGFQNYSRLTISPNSPFYTAVDHLPRDRQGDEICRGLAFGLSKYFKELPEVVKSGLIAQSAHSRGRRPDSAPTLFDEQHAANIASTMVYVENVEEVIKDVEAALSTQYISHVDIDLVLPPGSISALNEDQDVELEDDETFDPSLKQYGEYAPLVKLFGEVAFLPTSKLRRAPSKALNRTKSFLKEQKMSLRREMGELVDTEERYVIKMHELVNHIAEDFRAKAKSKAFGSFSPSEQDLQKLFPSSLDKILQINSAFLDDIRKVMDESEEEAMQDLESDQVKFTRSRFGGNGRLRDPTGALAFSKVLLEWFPKFSDSYQDYIRSSQDFPQLISSFIKQQSSFSKRVQQTGEQRLRSAVIEPVQRLPRYSLFIDNIVNYLPVTHPAMQSMLKARDMITSICSLDPPTSEKSQVITRLRNIVEGWPANLSPQGRLISAVDFIELPSPYHVSSNPMGSYSGMMLLFRDTILVLRKVRGCSLSARGVIAEVDKPSAAAMMASVTAAAGGQRHVYELSLAGSHSIANTRFTESSQGRVTWMTSVQNFKDAVSHNQSTATVASVKAFVLQGAYEGKASKWTEEVAKARIEGRFSESERETDQWCLRNANLKESGLNIYAAVFEEGIDCLVEGRREPAPIRLVVDNSKGTKGAPVGHYGVEIVAGVSTTDLAKKGCYRLEIDGMQDKMFVDSVDATTFMPVFAKRVGDLLKAHYRARNPALTTAFISHNIGILKSINVVLEGEKFKAQRPPSPVKMFSNFISSGGSISSASQKNPRTPVLGNVPSMLPPLSRSGSQAGPDSSHDSRSSLRTPADDVRPANPLMRLEETFTGYVAALQSRKGNIVGKVLRTRSSADELVVNALYNSFIENPFDTRASSEASVDILFCAFEKFLRMAWKEQMGLITSVQTLQALQEKSVKLFPGDFADFIKAVFSEMAPQNKRAFIAIIKLLADLLDGCGNDGDRGAMTVAFAELLVSEGDPHDYINLLDRMVEDSERLFEDIGPGASTGYTTPQYGSMSSTTRSTRSINTGSLTSNASSLRKRFGLDTLLRQNSNKTDPESRPSMWRTLSKNSRNAAGGEQTSSSLSKGSLNRSRSIDVDNRIESPGRRPVSRDRPSILGAFDERPASSHSRLSTIGASPPQETAVVSKLQKKKRRSSLSDLKALMAATSLDSPASPNSPRRALPVPTNFNSSPRTPSPSKSIMNRTIKYQGDSPLQKDESTSRPVGSLMERPQSIMPEDPMIVKESWSTGKGHKPTQSLSNIPTLNGAVREQVGSVAGPSLRPTSSPVKASPQKLRLQNPQKLRERLQNEAKAISAAEASLQMELSSIGEEMAKLNVSALARTNPADITKLSESVKVLESKIPVMIKDLTIRNDAIKKDLETSLQASEYKVKGLDQLYKETSAENELLYEKFNAELGKIVKALKGKGKEDKEELIVKTKQASEETARLKKENARLRRELLTLKTLVKGNE